MFFSDRDTMEFRLHTPTLNYQKIINWLFIINAIILFAEQNTEEIIRGKKVSINDVLYSYVRTNETDSLGAALYEYLLAYYKHRCEVFNTDRVNGVYASPEELSKDSTYVFNHSFAQKYIFQ